MSSSRFKESSTKPQREGKNIYRTLLLAQKFQINTLNSKKHTHSQLNRLKKKKLTQRANKKVYEPNLNECRLDLKREKNPFSRINITTLIQAVLYLYRNVFINVQSLLIRIKVIDYYTISGCLKGNSFVPARSKTNTKGASAVPAGKTSKKGRFGSVL